MSLLDNRLPRLVIHYPTCGHCGYDVSIEDDTAWCEQCRISWPSIRDGDAAVPDPQLDDTNVVCEIERPEKHVEYMHKGKWIDIDYHPCILPSGHESEHLWPYDYQSSPIEISGEN